MKSSSNKKPVGNNVYEFHSTLRGATLHTLTVKRTKKKSTFSIPIL